MTDSDLTVLERPLGRAASELTGQDLTTRSKPTLNIRDDAGEDRIMQEAEAGPELIRASVAARWLGKHVRTLARWSDEGVLPEPVRLGPRGDRHYLKADIDALLQNGPGA